MLMDHNIPVYEKFEAMLKEHSKVILITATGTGKSYVTAEYLERHNLRALVIAPRIAICDNWKKISNNVETITYHSFYLHCNEYKDYDVYVFDEAHHIGAEKWGPTVENFMESNDSIYIGLTAESKRFSDDIDVAEYYFDNHIVYGYNQQEAIEKNILPGGRYICSVFDKNEFADFLNNKDISLELRGRLKYSLENSLSINEILKKHIPNNHRKGIVFVDSIGSINNAIDIIRSCFPKANIFNIHSKLSKKEVKETLDLFINSEDGYIISVDMLNEGLHIENINTIIMLRKTSSSMIYMQQIGRGLAPENKDVIIFDFVANKLSLKFINDNLNSLNKIKSDNEFIRSSSIKISNQTIIFDYASDILEILREIASNKKWRFWTIDEDNILREYYPKIGLKVREYLCDRTKAAIMNRTQILKISGPPIDPNLIWTNEEVEILKNNYPSNGSNIPELLNKKSRKNIASMARKLGIKYENYKNDFTEEEDKIIKDNAHLGEEIVKLLPNRKIQNIRSRAKKLGVNIKLHKRYWSEEEDNILKENYPKIGPAVKDLLPNRNTKGIRSRAIALNLEYNTSKWTEEEDNILRECYPEIGTNVKEFLPNRNIISIKARVARLGIKKIDIDKWSDEELRILIEKYPYIGGEVKKFIPGKSIQMIRNKASNLGLKIIKWTEEEDEILREYYPEIGINVIDLLDNQSITSIRNRVHKLGIKRINRNWSKEEDEILRENYPKYGLKISHLIPNRTKESIHKRAYELGLRKE